MIKTLSRTSGNDRAPVENGSTWAVPMLIKAGADPVPAREHFSKYGLRKGSPEAVLALYQ